MNKEEKEAIERIQKRIKDNEDYSTNQVWLTEDVRCARVVLNLIQKQDEIIDKMADYMKEKDIDEDICVNNVINPQLCNEQLSNCKECIKEYFKKVV